MEEAYGFRPADDSDMPWESGGGAETTDNTNLKVVFRLHKTSFYSRMELFQDKYCVWL